MSKILRFFSLLVLGFTSITALADDPIIGVSGTFVLDTKPPIVTLLTPNGGQNFPANQPILITWTATDDQPGINPVSIGFCGTNGCTSYQILVENLVNTGTQSVQPPLLSTSYGKFQVSVKDLYGNIGTDESNAYFTLTGGGVPVTIQVNSSSSGQGVTGATIQAMAGNTQYTALPTSTAGQYSLGLPPGYGYILQINANGYQTQTIGNLSFSTGGTYNLTYQLTPASLYSDYRIVPVALAPNPSILEIPEGGIGYAWFVVEGLVNGNWLPVPDINLTSQDGQGNSIPCATNLLSYNFLSSVYHMQNAGVFSVKIPSSIIGNGNPGDQEVITVVDANGTTLSTANRQSIIAKVKQYTYAKSWAYRIYGKLGAGGTVRVATATGFAGGGSGSAMKIDFSGLSSTPTWSAFEISRRRDVFAGVDFEVGPPDIIPFVDPGYKNETKASFPYQSDYSFDMNSLPGLESLLAFYLFYETGIIFAGQVLPGGVIGAAFLNWTVQTLIENSAQNGLGVSRYADEVGLDISNTQSLNVSIGRTSPNSFGLAVGPNLGANVHVGGSVRKTTSNTMDARMYVSGGYDANISIGPKWIGSNNQKAKFLYPFRLRNVTIPTSLDIEFEGKYTEVNSAFESFQITAAVESNSSALNLYNLSGQKQKYKVWLNADNEYVRNLLYNCTQLPSKITNIGQAGIQIATQSNTFEQATTSFLSAIYDEQNNSLPAKLKYGLDAEANTVFGMDIDLEFPIPVFPAVVVKVGGGIEANHSTEYSIADGYWVKALPYLHTEMPSPPNPQVSFAEAMNELWSHVTSGQVLTELQNVILSHLGNRIIKWLGGKSITQNVALNSEGSYLKINAQSIPAGLDSLTCKFWHWDENGNGDKLIDPQKQEIITKYVKAVKRIRQMASGLEIGTGGFYKFEPVGYEFGDSTLISITYPDSVVTGIDENSLAVFWEDTLGVWHYLPSVPNPDSNRVTAYIQHFTTYTVAPIMPHGEYELDANPDSIPADGISTVVLTSDLMYNADSTIIDDGRFFTLSASRGTILTPDTDPSTEGIQVQSQNGIIQFQLKSDTVASPIEVMAISMTGYAKCLAEVILYDGTPPAAPVITSAIAVENAVILQWDSVADIDLAGYKIYFDKDSPDPPYNGTASVWGSPSPVNVGMTNSYKLSGLGNDTTVYIALTAFDISGNESDFSNVVEVFVSPPPSVLNLEDDTVGNGMENCYASTQTITVAGNGTVFQVEDGGRVTLVAGKTILMLPGTRVFNGGYLHAYITNDEQFCNLLDTNILINPDLIPILIETPTQFISNSLFRIYPNPTSGRFTIAFNEDNNEQLATIAIYNLFGKNILSEKIRMSGIRVYSMENQPQGLYLIRVIAGNRSETAKIIKQ